MIRTAQARNARERYRQMAPVLNEQSLRRFVAMEARVLGRGGVRLMSLDQRTGAVDDLSRAF
jgi:hypothetical protein